MPRLVRDSNLETRTARSRLKVAHKPYFRLIEPGLHLGYRKLASGPGTWIARRYNSGKGSYTTENLRTVEGALVLADDFSDADGEQVLSFAQAQGKAKGARAGRAAGAYTVADAMSAYFRLLKSEGRPERSIQDARYRDEAFIKPRLGEVKVAALTPDRLRRWRDELAHAAPRLRTKKGDKQKHRAASGDEDAKRARRASANRTWTLLRAALNHAFHDDGKVDSDLAWRKVKPFRRVEAARIRYLTLAEAIRLIDASDSEFRPLAQAALQTGARYGELVRLQVQDFDADAGTIAVRQSKTDKPRHIVLTDDGVNLFRETAAGRAGDALMLQKANGGAWGPSHQRRPMSEATKRAKITPAISFHGLRHTWASLAVMNGMPLMVVARNLGHVDTRMVEKHYGHLAPSYVAEAVRKSAPKFGFKPSNVRTIG